MMVVCHSMPAFFSADCGNVTLPTKAGGDGSRFFSIRDRLPAREVQDWQFGWIVTELGEVGADVAIALAELAVGEFDPPFDIDDGRLPFDARFLQRRLRERNVAD